MCSCDDTFEWSSPKDLDSDFEVTIGVSDIRSFRQIDLGTGALIHCRNGKEYRVKTPTSEIAAMMLMLIAHR